MVLSSSTILTLGHNQSINRLNYDFPKSNLFWEKINWTKLLTKISFWLVAEIYLNLIALDDFADMSEYILMAVCDQQHQLIQISIVEEKN